MSHAYKPTTPAEMYDRALHYGHDTLLPADYPRPHPTADWLPENILLLKEYWQWLAEGGASPATIRIIYLPMAGHILGLALKPYAQLDLETDLKRGLDFLYAKQLSAEWTDICRNAMLKFRRFLAHRRGQVETKITSYDPERFTEGLPDWLVIELKHYQHVQQRNWRTARLDDAIRRFWTAHLNLWRFLCERYQVKELADVHRSYLHEYIDERLAKGYAISSINNELRTFHSLMVYLQSEGYAVPQVLLYMHTLKQPDSLPRFLTDEQVRLLRDEMERRVAQAENFRLGREALMDRAAFYLLWQSGMRLGEVEELRLEDLDLAGRRLTVRQGKNLKDRTVYMTDTTVRAVKEYLAVRGAGPTDHVFLYRNQPMNKDLMREHIKVAGKQVGVKVYPHRLRHTAATQLLNAGCRITSIQKFLGHKELSTTMIYARVHDQTVSDDYYMAMKQVEKRLELLGTQEEMNKPLVESERSHLLALTARLAEPELSMELRLEITAEMHFLLVGRENVLELPVDNVERRQLDHPPPSLNFSEQSLYNPILCGC